MTNAIEIRPALPNDAQALSHLINENAKATLAPYYTLEQWEAFIAYYSVKAMSDKIATQSIFCATLKNEIVGTIGLENNFVLGFYTRLQNLNQGIGTAMMQYLENYASNIGLSELQLAASPVATAFYYKTGWIKVKDTIFIYRGVPFNETLMSKKLSD